MVEVLGIEMHILQLIGIIAVIILFPFSIWNIQHRKRKKQQEMLFGSSYSSSMSNENEVNTSSLSPEIEEQAKNYILQYQASYPKESLEQGVMNLGITAEQAKEVVDRYYNK